MIRLEMSDEEADWLFELLGEADAEDPIAEALFWRLSSLRPDEPYTPPVPSAALAGPESPAK